ncbi:MAG: hypothetical protein AB7T48_05470 [Solirubrobacterales bacterium]
MGATRGQDEKTAAGDRTQHRHRAFGRGRREHQLEEGDGVVDPLADRPQRAVAVVGDDDDALGGEGDHGGTQQAVAAARDRAPPDVGDRGEEADGDRRVG